MKKIFIFSMISLFLQCRPQDNKPLNKIISGQKYNCTLTETLSDYTGCGVFRLIYGMKFRLDNENSEAVVLIACPDQYDKNFFKKGEDYSIRLTDTAQNSKLEGSIIINSYTKSNTSIYYGEDVSKTK